MTNIMQLATGLIVDLHLNKILPKEPVFMMLEYDASGCPKPPPPTVRTLEERRAAVACWSISQL